MLLSWRGMKLLLYLLKQLQTGFTCCCRRQLDLAGWRSMSRVMLRAWARAKKLMGSTPFSPPALHSSCIAPFWQEFKQGARGHSRNRQPLPAALLPLEILSVMLHPSPCSPSHSSTPTASGKWRVTGSGWGWRMLLGDAMLSRSLCPAALSMCHLG